MCNTNIVSVFVVIYIILECIVDVELMLVCVLIM